MTTNPKQILEVNPCDSKRETKLEVPDLLKKETTAY
jgi:hypothetical protein